MTLFDLICFVILAAIVAISVYKGFVWVIMRFAAVVVSWMGARALGPQLSDFFYSQIIYPKVMPEMRKYFEDGFQGTMSELSDSLLEMLPEGVGDIARSYGLLPVESDVMKNVLSPEYIEREFVEPIITKIVLSVTIVLLFLVISIILRVIIHFINKKFFEEKHGVISNINRVFGGVFGLLRGAVTLSVIVMASMLIAPLTENPQISDAVSDAWITGVFSSILI